MQAVHVQRKRDLENYETCIYMTGAPNKNIGQNHFSIELLNVF